MNFSFKALLLCFQISIHYTCDFFLQKQQTRAAREEGVISLSLQAITKIMRTKEKQGLHL